MTARKTMTKTTARANARAAASAYIAREQQLQQWATDWLLAKDRMDAIQSELNDIVQRFYGEGISRAEIAGRLGVQVRNIPAKAKQGKVSTDEPNSGTDSSGLESETQEQVLGEGHEAS